MNNIFETHWYLRQLEMANSSSIFPITCRTFKQCSLYGIFICNFGLIHNQLIMNGSKIDVFQNRLSIDRHTE